MSIDTNLPLAGKVAIVTGASRGIGRAIAERLAADGASVVVNYARNEAAAREVVDGIISRGGSAISVNGNISLVSEVKKLFTTAKEKFGRLDILVNNAGDALFGPITETTEETFDMLFDLNVKGVYFAMQEAAKVLEAGGRIVNISSGVTILGVPQAALYGGTKGAIEQFAMSAAKELGPRGITVNVVSPGMTETDLLKKVVPEEFRTDMSQTVPLGRLGQPDDIADVVGFLASDAGRWVTGQNIRATGGAS